MATIGMVGIGAMGAPMARNLLKAGYAMKIYDTTASAVDALVAHGAEAATADTVARDVEAVITMLPDGAAVSDVLTGRFGLFGRAAGQTLFVDSSTIAVATARTLSTQAGAAGMAMIDAPVSGGVPGAEAATLTFMVGGATADVDRARPMLAAIGRWIVHAGPAGSGQAAKLCNNMILGISMIAVAEAFELAAQLELDAATLNQIVCQSSGNCWVLEHNHPVPGLAPSSAANQQYRAGFSSALMLKDLALSQDAARQCGAYTPMGAKAAALYAEFVGQGHGALDFAAIIRKMACGKPDPSTLANRPEPHGHQGAV